MGTLARGPKLLARPLSRIRAWMRRSSRHLPENVGGSDAVECGPDQVDAPECQPATESTPEKPELTSERIFGADQVRAALIDGAAEVRAAHGEEGDDIHHVLRTLTDRRAHTIRQIPWAAQSVLMMLRRRGYGLNEVTRLIEKDPALSQSLLRHANSAYYAVPGEPIESIKRAIQRVGTEGVHSVVMHQAIKGQLSRPGGQLNAMAKLTWKHMVRTAPICRDLAGDFGIDPERAFTLGLLHDVGKLVFFDHVADQRRVRRKDLDLREDAVRDTLAKLHQPLGALALLEWGMDEVSASVICHHHTPFNDPNRDLLTEIIYVSERLDLASERGEAVCLDTLWREGSLRGPMEAVEAYLEVEPQAA